jgi:hypothetical protein
MEELQINKPDESVIFVCHSITHEPIGENNFERFEEIISRGVHEFRLTNPEDNKSVLQ